MHIAVQALSLASLQACNSNKEPKALDQVVTGRQEGYYSGLFLVKYFQS